jgi:hypothetical protein
MIAYDQNTGDGSIMVTQASWIIQDDLCGRKDDLDLAKVCRYNLAYFLDTNSLRQTSSLTHFHVSRWQEQISLPL